MYLSTLSPASYGLGSQTYERNLIEDCFGPERLEEYLGKSTLSLLLVCCLDEKLLRQAPGNRTNAVMVPRTNFEHFSLPQGDGEYYLSREAVVGAILLEPNGFLDSPEHFVRDQRAEMQADSTTRERLIAVFEKQALRAEDTRYVARNVLARRSAQGTTAHRGTVGTQSATARRFSLGLRFSFERPSESKRSRARQPGLAVAAEEEEGHGGGDILMQNISGSTPEGRLWSSKGGRGMRRSAAEPEEGTTEGEVAKNPLHDSETTPQVSWKGDEGDDRRFDIPPPGEERKKQRGHFQDADGQNEEQRGISSPRSEATSTAHFIGTSQFQLRVEANQV